MKEFCIKIIDLFFNIINETKSYFVPEKLKYEVIGECKKCGKCCNCIYSLDTYTEKEFKFMQMIYPPYRRFYIKGKDERGNFVFACKYVSTEGLCTVYNKRPRICKVYPNKKIHFPGELHEGCGYKVVKKNFEDYLKG